MILVFTESAYIMKLFTVRPAFWKGCVVAVLVCGILGWQLYLYSRPTLITPDYRLRAASGSTQDRLFLYFLYNLNKYPVTSQLFYEQRAPTSVSPKFPPGIYNTEDARRIARDHGDTLVMDVVHSVRYGEHMQAFLYLPNAVFTGSAENPTMKSTNAAVFIGGLIALFICLSRYSSLWLAIAVTGLLGSNPFQLYETYVNENIFSWPISLNIILMAIHLPVLLDKPLSFPSLAAIAAASGIAIGTAAHIHPAVPALALAPALAYLAYPALTARRRVILVLILAAAFVATNHAWTNYFKKKISEAGNFVSRFGGHPYPGPFYYRHFFWHPIWAGLGDFDKTYGHKYDDLTVYAYVEPILESKYNILVPKRDTYVYQDYWDQAALYYKKPEELPHYEEVLRDSILHDILKDPLWYFRIVALRIWRVFTKSTPASLQAGIGEVRATMSDGIAALVLSGSLLIMLHRRRFDLLKVSVFTLPLAIAPIAVYSGRGMAYYSVFHLVVYAEAIFLLGKFGIDKFRVVYEFGYGHACKSRTT